MIFDSPEIKDTSHMQNAAKTVAVIGAVFSLVFLILLIINGYQQYVKTGGAAARLTDLKQQLLAEPDNENLIEEIRELDRDYRADKLRQLDFANLGSLMLLISAAVTIGAMKWHSHLKGINPELCIENAEPYKKRDLNETRTALLLFVFLLAGTAFLLERQTPSGWIEELQAGMTDEPQYAALFELAQNWHRFRGFAGAGKTDFADIPEKWDNETGEGILWKASVPLPGFNSPIVWKDRVFLTGADENSRQVYCYDALTGSLLWTGNVPTAPGDERVYVMEYTGYAASSMATDGVRVYAIFATGDLVAFNLDGRLIWHKNLGIPENLYGHASSLEVWRDRVLVQYDQGSSRDGGSRLYAFHGATGNLIWEAERPVPNSWTTPVIAQVDDNYQLITVGNPWVIAYDPEDGREIWRADSVRGDVGASPIVAENLVIAIAPDYHNTAIRTGGMGDVTDTHIVWKNEYAGPTIVSPVADDERVYYMDEYGTLYAVSLSDGEFLYEFDFDDSVNASPSLVSGKLYVLSMTGTMFIGIPGESEFILESTNYLGEGTTASPAFMRGRIFIRGDKHLYSIGYDGN